MKINNVFRVLQTNPWPLRKYTYSGCGTVHLIWRMWAPSTHGVLAVIHRSAIEIDTNCRIYLRYFAKWIIDLLYDYRLRIEHFAKCPFVLIQSVSRLANCARCVLMCWTLKLDEIDCIVFQVLSSRCRKFLSFFTSAASAL